MIGYHFTAYESWLEIQEKGLQPRETWNDDLKDYFKPPIKGIWVYENLPKGDHKLFAILQTAAIQASFRVVLLAVKYDIKSVLEHELGRVKTYHSIIIENLASDKQYTARIVTKPIDVDSIILVDDYDLRKLIK